MAENFNISMKGYVTIKDSLTHEVLVDTHNDVLKYNASTALANALIGAPGSTIYYMAFGTGAASVDNSGLITYKPSIALNLNRKDYTANLYDTIYVKKILNDTSSSVYLKTSNVTEKFDEIVINVKLDYDQPSVIYSISTTNSIDNSTSAGSNSVTTINDLIFNEIGLFCGSTNIFDAADAQTQSDVSLFTDTGMYGNKTKLMLTHAIFHPIQKSSNRSLDITYTLKVEAQ